MKAINKKQRADRRHRFTLRLDRREFNKLRVVSFNAGISLNRACEMIIIAALEEGRIIDMIYGAHPPGKDQFIYIEDEEGV